MINSLFLLRNLRQNLRLGRLQLEQIQLKKLKALIRHAYENVPYYRDLFDSVRLGPGDINRVEDLESLPLTDKATLRALKKDEKTSKNIDIEACLEFFTSGSTAMPTQIYFTPEDWTIIELTYLRSFLKNGLKFRHKRAFILDPHNFETKDLWYHRVGLARYINISCFSDPEDQLQVLKTNRPHFIHGYPSSIIPIARLMIEKGYKDIRPALISTAAELLHKEDRKTIHAAFGVAPYDHYAARECGNIAWECKEHRGYHINIDTLVVEFIKDKRAARPGERADIVVTNLHSYSMPFIRYKIGDLGVPSGKSCPCGMEFPLMEIIEGRDEDVVVLKDGTSISPMMVTGTLDHIAGIRQFRVVQERIDAVKVTIARKEGFTVNTIDQVESSLKTLLGEDMVIKCNEVNDIPKESSGKVRAVISKVVN